MVSDKFRKLLNSESKLKEAKKICENAGYNLVLNESALFNRGDIVYTDNRYGLLNFSAIIVGRMYQEQGFGYLAYVGSCDDWDDVLRNFNINDISDCVIIDHSGHCNGSKVYKFNGTIKDFISFKFDSLNETGLALKGKVYPKFNNVLIAAGGAASGKGFVLKNVCLFDGKTFDVDELKLKVKKSKENSISWKEFEKFAIEKKYPKTRVSDLNLKDEADVSFLHNFCKVKGYDKHFKNIFFHEVSKYKNKPNVIFDITMKNIDDIDENIATYTKMGNYDPKNVHLVWILNSFDVALEQNKKRDRTVSLKIMFETHEGVVNTMRKLLEDFDKYRDVIDGDVYIVPNQAKVDSSVIKGKETEVEYKGKTYNRNVPFTVPDCKNPEFIEKDERKIVTKFMPICIKKSGEPARTYEDLETEILEKIRDYVPKNVKDVF